MPRRRSKNAAVKNRSRFSGAHHPGFCAVVTLGSFGMDPWVFAPLRVATPKDDEITKAYEIFFNHIVCNSSAPKIAC
ncbi:hypothetical protein CIT25_14945 [Mesorhizobium mediterraneum]|uniref:Uncharacterized protein n=1 Tax=Mesorhizobium mediterraneum TaxID=43617 RepID=A0AB36R9P6_9HYPH|nr:hypothetical protein CIT25_14945 [Mesorhizobium mediterraneum]